MSVKEIKIKKVRTGGQASLRKWHFRGARGEERKVIQVKRQHVVPWGRKELGHSGKKRDLAMRPRGQRGQQSAGAGWARQGHAKDLEVRKWPQHRPVGIDINIRAPVFQSCFLDLACVQPGPTCLLPSLKALNDSESDECHHLLSTLYWLQQKRGQHIYWKIFSTKVTE